MNKYILLIILFLAITAILVGVKSTILVLLVAVFVTLVSMYSSFKKER